MSFVICQCFFQDCVKFLLLCTIVLSIKDSRFEARRRVYSVHSVQPEMISEILFSVGVLPDNLIPIYTIGSTKQESKSSKSGSNKYCGSFFE